MKTPFLSLVAIALLSTSLHQQEAKAMSVTVASHERTTIYHSPQSPGYTCWVGVWVTPGGPEGPDNIRPVVRGGWQKQRERRTADRGRRDAGTGHEVGALSPNPQH